MSEAGQSTTGNNRTAPIDAFCDFVRHTVESLADAITPPDAACRHFRESRVEFLRGVRAIIDHRIERLSRNAQKGASVPVE